jgi:hypothetical protein
MKKKLSRSVQIPKYGTTSRAHLVSFVTSLPGYQEGISKGFPLFTSKELDEVKELYKDGLTWEDIDKLLSGKGIFFKKATFRKYIQKGNISKAIGYKNTENRRVAIFPADTIAHINFIQYYYKVVDGEYVDNVIDCIKDQQISYLEAIESNLSCDNIYASIFHYICDADRDTSEAIKKALECRPDDRDKILKMLDHIENKFNKIIRKDIDNLVSLLKKKTISVFETMDDNKEVKDEQN